MILNKFKNYGLLVLTYFIAQNVFLDVDALAGIIAYGVFFSLMFWLTRSDQ